MDIVLFDKIIPEESSATYLSTKVELKMKKRNQSAQWKTLESTGEKPTAAPIVDSTPAKNTKSKNWDKIANEVANGENLDEESDPLNKVFKDIYANASDDQKRAMQKSFVRLQSVLFFFLSLNSIIDLLVGIRRDSSFDKLGGSGKRKSSR